MKKLIAFPYYGGKSSHLKWLLPLLPKCEHYIEPFGGSGAVLLNREPSPLETYNDIYENVYTFFKVLRDNPDELIRLLELTPYSRQEFAIACENEDCDDVEKARRFFVLINQSIGAIARSTAGRWGYAIRDLCYVKRTEVNLSKIESLPKVTSRLMAVQIENKDAIDIIQRYDFPGALFYCDPPYLHSARVSTSYYKYEQDEQFHVTLAETLCQCTGKVAISGYDSELYRDLYKDWFFYTEGEMYIGPTLGPNTRGKRQEFLWTNYDAHEASGQLSLF